MHPPPSLSPSSQPGGWPRLPRFGSDGAAGLAVPTAPPADQPLLALPAEDTGYSVTLCSSEAAADTGAERVWRGAFDDERRTKRAWVGVDAVWMGGDGPALAVALASARSAAVLPLRVFAGGPIPSSWRRLLTDPQLQKISCRAFDVKSAIGRAGVRVRNLHDVLASCGRKYRQVYTTLSAATTDLLNLALPHMMPLRHTDWEASKLFMWQARMLALYAFGVFRVAELVRAQYFPPGGYNDAEVETGGDEGWEEGGKEEEAEEGEEEDVGGGREESGDEHAEEVGEAVAEEGVEDGKEDGGEEGWDEGAEKCAEEGGEEGVEEGGEDGGESGEEDGLEQDWEDWEEGAEDGREEG